VQHQKPAAALAAEALVLAAEHLLKASISCISKQSSQANQCVPLPQDVFHVPVVDCQCSAFGVEQRQGGFVV